MLNEIILHFAQIYKTFSVRNRNVKCCSCGYCSFQSFENTFFLIPGWTNWAEVKSRLSKECQTKNVNLLNCLKLNLHSGKTDILASDTINSRNQTFTAGRFCQDQVLFYDVVKWINQNQTSLTGTYISHWLNDTQIHFAPDKTIRTETLPNVTCY